MCIPHVYDVTYGSCEDKEIGNKCSKRFKFNDKKDASDGRHKMEIDYLKIRST